MVALIISNRKQSTPFLVRLRRNNILPVSSRIIIDFIPGFILCKALSFRPHLLKDKISFLVVLVAASEIQSFNCSQRVNEMDG